MITLPIIAVISSLSLAPVPGAVAAAPSHAVAAQQRLDRLTATASARLREQAIKSSLDNIRLRIKTQRLGVATAPWHAPIFETAVSRLR